MTKQGSHRAEAMAAARGSVVRSLTVCSFVVHRELQHGVHTKRIGSRALSLDYRFPDEFRADPLSLKILWKL